MLTSGLTALPLSAEMGSATHTGGLILSGIAIVFAILVVLILCIILIGRAIPSVLERSAQMEENSSRRKALRAAAKAESEQSAAAAAAPAAPVVEGDIPEETVAVISAAVAAYMDTGGAGSYAITGITRAKDSRPVWGFAGMTQNTRPF